MISKEAVFTHDKQNNNIKVVRSFDAALDQVWRAWSESEILDQWWAPRPYRAETKSMDFREGGSWLYCMAGPEGDRSWCIEQYRTIEPQKRIVNDVNFCDEQGNLDQTFPTMHWKKNFSAEGEGTTVHIEIAFDSEEEMDKIVAMGILGGLTMGMKNLDECLAKGL